MGLKYGPPLFDLPWAPLRLWRIFTSEDVLAIRALADFERDFWVLGVGVSNFSEGPS